VWKVTGLAIEALKSPLNSPNIIKFLCSQDDLYDTPNFCIHFSVFEYKKFFEKYFRYRISDLSDVFIFCGTPRAKDYWSWRNLVKEYTPDEKTKRFLKFITTRNIEPYFIKWRDYPINAFGKTFNNGVVVYNKKLISEEKWREFASIPKLIVRGNDTRITCALDEEGYVFLGSYALIQAEVDYKFLLGLINSSITQFYFKLKYPTTMIGGEFFTINSSHIADLPIVRATPDQQAPIISLVDAIIQKKKECYSISQNIEDYINLSKVNLINLDEFLKMSTQDFEALSSIKAKTDNFDALRVKIEENFAILEYGVKRKIEEYEEIDEEVERKGKYMTEWFEAGKGKIKDIEAIEFLLKVLEGAKNFSKAKQKSIWQKIAEVKIPEFNEKVKEGFLKFKSAMQKIKELDEEILRIDRAIDCLVYDLYGLTEEEIQVVEKSVWGDKFEEMYSRLPSKELALKLSKEYKKND
jgi:hypothetical protein